MKNITATKRTDTGKNAAGRLRRSGQIPANVIYDGKTTPIAVPEKDFAKLLAGGLRPSTLLNVEVEGEDKENTVFVKELQREPISGKPIHVDFYRVTPGRKVLVTVGVEHTGTAKGVKAGGALEHFIRTLKVKCVPEQLKDVLTVDITNLDVEESIHLDQLGIPAEWDVQREGNPIVLKVARSRLSQVDDTDAVAAPAEAAASEEAPTAG